MELFPGGVPSRITDKTDSREEFHPEEESVFSEFEDSEPELFSNIEESVNTFDPFIIECMKCSSLIRIKESGDQLCPYCSAEFTVADDKKAVFKIKNIHS